MSWARCAVAVLAAAITLCAQGPQNIAGTVLDLTNGAPLPSTQVALVQLTGTMPKVATTTTDIAGHYRFSQTSGGPFMVQADWQGVSYFAKVTPGQSETNVQVYDASHDPKQVNVDAEIMVLQPDAGQLAVVNEYRVENALQPPRTLSGSPGKNGGSGLFRFRVPPGATVDMVRVVAPGEMPLSRQAVPTAEHDIYAVDSPLRPGETQIQVSYRVPYSALKAALSESPVLAPAHFEVYVPSPMSFNGNGFTQVGEQDGYKVYGVAAPAPTMQFQVAGDAPMPSPQGQTSAAAPAAATGEASTGGEGASATTAPAPAAAAAVPMPTLLERNRWTILAFLGLAAAAGFGLLLAKSEAKPMPIAVAAVSLAADATPGLPAGTTLALPPAESLLPSIPASELARLKDDLFLLEVRRHTRNIGEDEYARQRAALAARMNRLAGH